MKKQLLALVVLGTLLSGCTASKGSYSGSIRDDEAEKEGAMASSSAPVEDVAGEVSSPEFASLPKEVDDERQSSDNLLDTRVVYFDFDKSLVREEFVPVVFAHAQFLLRNRDKGIVLGGHADSRGSNEYNLALGQRRADAVRDLMLAHGVQDSQLESLSFGEESPVASGEDEEAWQLNRRVEIRYTDE
jgi:peptidoglycan-associated lipoprotein